MDYNCDSRIDHDHWTDHCIFKTTTQFEREAIKRKQRDPAYC